MKSDNPSFVLHAIEKTAIENKAIPETKPDQVLVEVKKTGICGSDVHYLTHGRIGPFVVKEPMVLGHESSGVVAKVGSEVSHLKVGDRVAMEPGATCRKCEACKAGSYNLCPGVIFAATPPYDGTLCRYYQIPGDLAYPIPDSMSFEDGAMIEPLAVGVHSVAKLGQFRANQSVVVTGAGPVGLVSMAVAKALGATRIIAVDIVESRLEFAKGYAATHVYVPPKMEPGESRADYAQRNAEKMKKELLIEDRGPNSIDLVVECSGAEVSIQTAFHIAKSGGTIVQVGMGSPTAGIDIGALGTKELTYKGSFRYGPGDYPLAIALVSQGKIDLRPLVTHRYLFENALDAFNATKAGKSPDGKAVIKAMISGVDCSAEQA